MLLGPKSRSAQDVLHPGHRLEPHPSHPFPRRPSEGQTLQRHELFASFEHEWHEL